MTAAVNPATGDHGACLSADTRPRRTARHARSCSPAEPGPFRSGRRARRPTTRALAAWTKRGTATARWPSRPTDRPWFGGGHCLSTGPFGLARGQTLANRRASGAVRHRRRRAEGGWRAVRRAIPRGRGQLRVLRTFSASRGLAGACAPRGNGRNSTPAVLAQSGDLAASPISPTPYRPAAASAAPGGT